jgi:ankyrin repeat protein
VNTRQNEVFFDKRTMCALALIFVLSGPAFGQLRYELPMAVWHEDANWVNEILKAQPQLRDVVIEHGLTSIQWAAFHNKTKSVDILLRQGSRLDLFSAYLTRRTDEFRRQVCENPKWVHEPVGIFGTPLYWTIMRDDVESARFLLKHGAKVDSKPGGSGFGSRSPLQFAVDQDSYNVARLLLEHGAKVREEVPCYGIVSATTCFPRPEFVDLFLRYGANFKGKDGSAALRYAVSSGNSRVARRLLELGADHTIADEDGMTPLLHALLYYPTPAIGWRAAEIKRFKQACVRIGPIQAALLQPPLSNQQEYSSIRKMLLAKTPKLDFPYALLLNDVDAVKKYLKENPKLADQPLCEIPAPFPPIYYAAQKGYLEILKLLVNEYKVDPDGAVGPGGPMNPEAARERPLYTAAAHRQTAVVEFLLSKTVTVDSRDPVDDATPLIAGARVRSELKLIRLLIDAGADISAQDRHQHTALTYASLGSYDIVKLLLDHGAKVDGAPSRHRPLRGAIEQRRTAVVELLLERGAPIGADPQGMPPAIHHAAGYANSPEIIRLLLKHGAKVDDRSMTGSTPLHFAAAFGSLSSAEELLALKADINDSDLTGITPLHVAARAGKPKMVEMLLQHGADAKALDKKGQRPLDLTVRNPTDTSLDPADNYGRRLAARILRQHLEKLGKPK